MVNLTIGGLVRGLLIIVGQKNIYKPELALNFVTLVIHLYFHFTMGLAISEFALNHFAICTL